MTYIIYFTYGGYIMLTKIETLDLIRRWFKALNDHEPVEKLLEMLDQDDLEMQFPEAALRNTADFIEWYRGVTMKFFDQKHNLKNIEIDVKDNTADIVIYVNWLARTWKAPDAYSEFLDVDAFQTWQVTKDAGGAVRIKRYIVEMLESNNAFRYRGFCTTG